ERLDVVGRVERAGADAEGAVGEGAEASVDVWGAVEAGADGNALRGVEGIGNHLRMEVVEVGRDQGEGPDVGGRVPAASDLPAVVVRLDPVDHCLEQADFVPAVRLGAALHDPGQARSEAGDTQRVRGTPFEPERELDRLSLKLRIASRASFAPSADH